MSGAIPPAVALFPALGVGALAFGGFLVGEYYVDRGWEICGRMIWALSTLLGFFSPFVLFFGWHAIHAWNQGLPN